MTTVTELNIQMQQSISLIESEKAKLNLLSQEISEQVSKQYPLKSLIGKNSIFHRAKWGYIDGRGTELTDRMIKLHPHLKAYNLFKGQELNEKYETLFFNVDSTYVLYVGYETDCPQDENGLPSIYEFIAVKTD